MIDRELDERGTNGQASERGSRQPHWSRSGRWGPVLIR
jgi:hypothetical protein